MLMKPRVYGVNYLSEAFKIALLKAPSSTPVCRFIFNDERALFTFQALFNKWLPAQ